MRLSAIATVAALATIPASCTANSDDADTRAGSGSTLMPSGTVTLLGPTGTSHGQLQLETAPAGGVRVVGSLSGIPAGEHGLHIHAVGDCMPPDFASAGGHFNPEGRQHGLDNPDGAHAGDAPNVVADSSGQVTVDVVYSSASLDSAAATSVWDADGSAIVLHAASDDQRTDPSGNAGARIACGVIQRAQ